MKQNNLKVIDWLLRLTNLNTIPKHIEKLVLDLSLNSNFSMCFGITTEEEEKMRYGWQLVVLSFTLLTSQALISQEINAASLKNEECCRSTKKILNKYKEHLENTTWIVPPDTLLAYSYIAGMNIPVVDQTVWVINKFDNGYFFGNAYLSLNGTPSSQLNLVGSITSLGDVYIGFYPLPGSSSNAIVATGIGKFKKQNGQYQFIMQMNSPINNSVGLSHWSYMISVDKNDEFYWHLPGENISVPEFISQF